MKIGRKKHAPHASAFTSRTKSAAKANSLNATLVSFKIEGIRFSPEQIKSVKSRLHLTK